MMEKQQLTLEFEPSILDRFRNIREVVAAGVYQRGLKRVAGDMDVAPGNLSCMLNDDSQRKLGTDDLEHYIQTQGDLTPVHFLIARYLGNQAAVEGAVLSRVQDQLADMVAMVAQLTKAQGVKASRKK